jgi:GT2 family glycosyltransferase
MSVSICIPVYNDQLELDRTIESILKTTKDVEIVVCDDGSKVPIVSEHAKVIRHSNNIGVGAAIDTAVKNSSGDNIVISGSDMYYYQKNWLTNGLKLLDKDYKTIWSTGCCGYNPNTKKVKKNVRFGAQMIVKADRSDILKTRRGAFSEDWKMLFRSKWYSKSEVKKNQEVSSLLGACYFITRDWYNHLLGFSLHRYWGTLDSMLAMKSWLAGGSCRVATDIRTAHVFERPSPGRGVDWMMYNKIMNVRTLFPDKEEHLLSWIADQPGYEAGLNIANSHPTYREIEVVRDYLQSIFLRDYDWYINKFNLK